MARPRKPASLKQGNSESKTELKHRAAIEERLMGDSDKLYIVPEYLNEDAKVYYKFMVEELEVSSILSNLDIPLLEQMADCLSRLRECDSILNQEGMQLRVTTTSGDSVPKPHPIIDTKHKYLNQFRALCTQLGMSPAARANLAGLRIEKQKEQDDPLLKILRGD